MAAVIVCIRKEPACLPCFCDVVHVPEVHTLGEAPSKRTDHSVVLFRDSLLVFGGFDGHNRRRNALGAARRRFRVRRFNDLRELHLKDKRWSQVSVEGSTRAQRGLPLGVGWMVSKRLRWFFSESVDGLSPSPRCAARSPGIALGIQCSSKDASIFVGKGWTKIGHCSKLAGMGVARTARIAMP